MKQGIVFLILLSCLHVFAGLEIVRILPNKINYKLNEDAVISVTVANRGGTKESAELIVYQNPGYPRSGQRKDISRFMEYRDDSLRARKPRRINAGLQSALGKIRILQHHQ